MSIKRIHFFVQNKEKYLCEYCGEMVMGGRYNNHCPKCLWSKHLDESIPGDRKSNCKALMKPVGISGNNNGWRIVHQCTGCSKVTVVDAATDDNLDLIIKLSGRPVPELRN